MVTLDSASYRTRGSHGFAAVCIRQQAQFEQHMQQIQQQHLQQLQQQAARVCNDCCHPFADQVVIDAAAAGMRVPCFVFNFPPASEQT